MQNTYKTDGVGVFMLIFVGLMLLVAALTSCAPQPKMTEGVVVERQHLEQVTISQLQHIVIGKVISLTTVPHVLPESWQILISDGDLQEWVNVTASEYACVEVGDYVALNGNLCGGSDGR